MRNPFLQKIILLLLVFGLSIHASGMDHLLLHGNFHTSNDSDYSSIDKSDYTSLFDLNDNEIELELEDENELETSSFLFFHSLEERNQCWKLSNHSQFKSFKQRHSYKLPLFIHFENYRL